MLSPTYKEYESLRNYLVIRSDGTIHFKTSPNKFGIKVVNPNLKERRMTFEEFQEYYADICMIMVGNLY